MAEKSAPVPRRRGPGRPFTRGQSGNPGGRPAALASVMEAAKAHTALAVATLAEIAGRRGEPAAARVTAAVALLDRGWGRPRQPIEAEGLADLAAALEGMRVRRS